MIKRANGQSTSLEDEVLKEGGNYRQDKDDDDLFEDACDSSYDEDSDEEYCKKPAVAKKKRAVKEKCAYKGSKGGISNNTKSKRSDFAREYVINNPIN